MTMFIDYLLKKWDVPPIINRGRYQKPTRRYNKITKGAFGTCQIKRLRKVGCL